MPIPISSIAMCFPLKAADTYVQVITLGKGLYIGHDVVTNYF